MASCSVYLLLVAVHSLLSFVDSHPEFQAMIPNGQRVPSPCDVSMVWMGTGHQAQAGGGPLNRFGVDFKLHNYVCCFIIS